MCRTVRKLNKKPVVISVVFLTLVKTPNHFFHFPSCPVQEDFKLRYVICVVDFYTRPYQKLYFNGAIYILRPGFQNKAHFPNPSELYKHICT